MERKWDVQFGMETAYNTACNTHNHEGRHSTSKRFAFSMAVSSIQFRVRAGIRLSAAGKGGIITTAYGPHSYHAFSHVPAVCSQSVSDILLVSLAIMDSQGRYLIWRPGRPSANSPIKKHLQRHSTHVPTGCGRLYANRLPLAAHISLQRNKFPT